MANLWPFAYARQKLAFLRQVDRDARYVLLLFAAVPILLITTIQALNKGWFDSFERPVFNAVNSLPHLFYYPFWVITQFGSLGSLVFWLIAAYVLVNRRCSLIVATSGLLGWLLAKPLKNFVHRGRPGDFFHNIQLFHSHFSGFGFPSGHACVSAACATALYYQVAPRYRKYLLWLVFLVGLSRMYLGAHFPLDVVGGWALGATIGSAVTLAVGNSHNLVRASYIRRILKKHGYELETVRFLQLDARGSKPIYIKSKDGSEFFAKLFGSQEQAADWLFRVYRLFRYKNLQAEEPSFNNRRNVEVEALASLWARKARVRVPDIKDLIKAGRYWLLVQEKINATPLSELKRIPKRALEDSWRQVKKLHDIPMAHRDLRAANLMIDAKSQAWLIDFGFAETSPNKARIHMDNAELLMSMGLIAGVRKTVDAAYKMLGAEELELTLPYLQRSVFSGATRQALRKNSGLLDKLIEALKQKIRYKGEVEEADIDRLNLVKIINLALLGIFLYIILPQFKEFKAAFVSINDIRYWWVSIVALFSLLTYISAGLIYVILADRPLKLKNTAVIQLAASFMTKILPAGIGGTGLTTRYLLKSGYDSAGATSIILVQSLIGFVMFSVPLLIFLLFTGNNISSQFHHHVSVRTLGILAGVLILAAALLALSRKLRLKLIRYVAGTITELKELTSSPLELGLAAATSLSITAFYIACLYASAHAIHINLTIADAIYAYVVAIIAKTAIPTPGGLGPIEVAMAASLAASGLSNGQAIATVIIYRLATFWVPIPFSYLAFRYAQRQKLI